jgi:hypothetical protein
VSGPRSQGVRRRRRRKLALALGGILAVAAAAGLGWRREGRADHERLAEQADARARAEDLRASQAAKQDRLIRKLHRLQGPPARVGALLAALSRATPPAILLREVACQEENFTIRGCARGTGTAAGDLFRFRRELCPPEAPWQVPEPPAGTAEFTWRGAFARPADPAAGALDPAVAEARAALRPAPAFDAWLRGWSPRWRILAHSAEASPEVELRHYALAYAQPTLGAWSDIVQAVRAAEAEPGVSVDSLVLAAAPDGADAFAQAQLTLTARLRP